VIGSADLVAFVPTADLGRARPFYEDVLGLTLVTADDLACMFDSNGTLLRVNDVGAFTPARFTIVGWAVADIAAEVSDLVARGVTFERYPGFEQNELGIWTAPDGTQVAWFRDPDGNTLSVAQTTGDAAS
jgi:catechol 2,3-dioxygenase-like lactoylglutathione lyase family enzyme